MHTLPEVTFLTFGSSGEAPEPIGYSAEHHLSPIGGRGRQSEDWTADDVQTVTLRPLRRCSPKKRKVNEHVTLYLSEDEFADAFEKIAEKALGRLTSQKTTNATADSIDLLRNEVQNSIKEVQTRAAII